MRSASGIPYSVVRWRGVRPAARMASSMRSGGISWPWLRRRRGEIDSFISVPPRSFTPAAQRGVRAVERRASPTRPARS